ncbi:MAG: nuclear transport factor 2 family protein [Pseudomonadota bacterium]
MKSAIPYAAAFTAALLFTATTVFADRHATSESLVTEFFGALSDKNFEKIEAFFAPDAVVLLPFAAGQDTTSAPVVFEGMEQLMAYYRGAGQRIAEVGFVEPEVTLSPDGSIVFVENAGDMVLPDGRDYENRYVWRFTIEEGRFSEVREYYDPKVADTAFGRN